MGSGPEFNPLTEKDRYGEVNPYQDPARGRFVDVTADSEGEIELKLTDLEQNLAGEQSILGRSLTVISDADGEVLGCCTIGLEDFDEIF